MDENLTFDATLSRSILYSSVGPKPSPAPSVALLTGATGFLGVSLLRDLLTYTLLEVVCLVRASSEGDAIRRLRHALQSHRLWRTEFEHRIRPVIGDLAKPRLGLSDREFLALGKRIDVIYHNAAQTNLVFPYRALRPTNVLGTLEMLRLAAIAPVRSFHHISSIAVVGSALHEQQAEVKEDFCVGRSADLTNGYVRTKWVAEQLVNEAAHSGLGVSIYRPGLITGHSRTGVCNVRDTFSLMLRACIWLAVAPEFPGIVYLTPVDFVSRAIFELSRKESSRGKAFHINNPVPVSWEQVAELLRACGHVRQTMPYREWLLLLQTQAEQASQKELELAAGVPDS